MIKNTRNIHENTGKSMEQKWKMMGYYDMITKKYAT
jgi:hypothetical protein